MHRRRLLLKSTAAGALACLGLSAALALVSSCDSRPVFPIEEPPDSAPAPIVSGEASADGAPGSPPRLEDASARADAKTDASDRVLPGVAACSTFEPIMCDFNGNCYPLAGVGISGGVIGPTFPQDGGRDGSTAFALKAYDGDGGGAFFQLPFRALGTTGPAPLFPGCRVLCEVNVRVEQGGSANQTVLSTDAVTLSVIDGGWLHRGSGESVVGPPLDAEWVHLSFVFAPTSDGGATTTITFRGADDASTTTFAPGNVIGESIRLGGSVAAGGENYALYADDLWCHIVD